MEDLGFTLLENEGVYLKEPKVKHGGWGAYSLVLTDYRIALIERGLFGRINERTYYALSEIAMSNGIPQVYVGVSQNGDKQLDIFFQDGRKETFSFEESALSARIWAEAISDRFKDEDDVYNYQYYQEIVAGTREYNPSDYPEDEEIDDEEDNGIDVKYIGDVAKSVLKSGNFTMRGVMKGIKTADKKRNKQQVKKTIYNEVLDELGIYDIQNVFPHVFP